MPSNEVTYGTYAIHSHALQLRQAKLSFPNVTLLVGVLPDDPTAQFGLQTSVPQVERCELVRHCRWVDEVLESAPWCLDKNFLAVHKIDFVAVDEGASVDPLCQKVRLQGYDSLKALGTCRSLHALLTCT
jgi:glycerol-3-phosphate cytidylyltransferase-like family protein